MNEFTHLHCHTGGLSEDALGKHSSLVSYAAKIGCKALAITDHGTVGGVIAHIVECNQQGIKPIIGVEAYVKGDDFEGVGHLTLLADGDKGWATLVKLQNQAHLEFNPSRKSSIVRAPIDLKWLEIENEGLIVLSGCMASPFQSLPELDSFKLFSRLKKSLGSRLFIEMMLIGDNLTTFERSLKLAEQFKNNVVLTNDVHFTEKSLYPVKEVLMDYRGYQYPAQQLWLKSYDELMARTVELKLHPNQLAIVKTAIDNANKIASLIEVPHLLHSQSIPEIKNADNILIEKTTSNLEDWFGVVGVPSDYRNRLAEELNVIINKKFSSYFLILEDIVNETRKQGIRCDVRGSASGSLVLHLLGISDSDPIAFNLSFARFLNYKRSSFPDVDIDIASEGREFVINYTKNKYQAFPIAAYSEFGIPSLTHAVAKWFHLSREDESDIAENGFDASCWNDVSEKNPLINTVYDTILGQINHKTVHAAGIALPVEGLSLPLERTKNGDLAVPFAQSDNGNKYLALAGFTKIDFLSLSALDAVSALSNELTVDSPKPFETDDQTKREIYQLCLEGKFEGIFQFNASPGIRKLLMKILTETGYYDGFFEQLVAAVSLYRPAAMAQIDDYILGIRNGGSKTGDKFIDKVLEPTFGILLYQEQMMSITAYILANYNGPDIESKIDQNDADLARRLIVTSEHGNKKWELSIQELEARFKKNTVLAKPLVNKMWNLVIAGTGYGFNRSHAVSYALRSWEMLWYRLKFPVSFFTSCLNTDPDKLHSYLFAAATENIEVVPPHINVSTTKFEHDGTKIYCPLTLIKGLGETSAVAITKAREAGLFRSLEHFRSSVAPRSCNSSNTVKLIELGAFEGFNDLSELEVNKIVKPKEIYKEGKSIIDAQVEHIGYVVPNLKLVTNLSKHLKGKKGGIVSVVTEKVSGYGVYFSYRFLNGDGFWIRDGRDPFKVGQIVIADSTSSTGKAIGYYRLELEDLL